MQLTAIIMLTACLQVAANTAGQTVTLKVKNAPLKQVLVEIQEQTGFSILFDNQLVEKAGRVTLNVRNMPVNEVMNICLKDRPFQYLVSDNSIVIKPLTQGLNPRLSPQDFKPEDNPPITGIIRDADGNPIAGVNVVVKGTRRGVTTDAAGKFSLEVAVNEVLVISSIGYNAREVKIISTNIPHIIALDKSVSELDEVVYNKGYYTEKQRLSLSNMTTIKAADLEKQPVNNPLLALQGRVPGLNIIQQSGVNGSDVSMQIQGRNTIRAGTNPLVIVDGVPYATELPELGFTNILGNSSTDFDAATGGSRINPLGFLNLNEIETIDVLKDADATSIYGSQAANGAIVITTKRGKPGKMRVNVTVQQGWHKVPKKMEMMNRRQYLDMRYEAFKNAGLIPVDRRGLPQPNTYAPDLTVWDTTRETDWQKELIGRSALYTNVAVGFSGGTGNTFYSVGTSYNSNTTVFPGDYAMEGGALHFSLNTSSANQKLKMQVIANYSFNQNNLPGVDLTGEAIRLVPVAPALFNADTINWAPDPRSGIDTWDNPLGPTYYKKFEAKGQALTSNVQVGYVILQNLEVRARFGYTSVHSKAQMINPLAAIRPVNRAFETRSASFNTSANSNLLAEPELSYKHSFSKLNVDALIGGTFRQNNTDLMIINGSGYTSDLLLNSIIAAPVKEITNATSVIYKYLAAFSRLNVNWNDKYLLNITARRDGSSRFGDKRKFHDFGSAAVGWIFTEEHSISKALPWLTFGKLKTSYGTTGNDGVGDYQHLTANISNAPAITYQGSGSMLVARLTNPYFQWEDTRKWNTGIDLGIFKDRLMLSVNYARNRSTNLLITQALPGISGFAQILQNNPAVIVNTSWEAVLSTLNVKSKKFSWTSSINLTIPRNKLVAFPGIEETIYASPSSGIIIGQPYGVLPISKYYGMDPATGEYLTVDRHDNPVPFQDTLNKSISLNPHYYGGWRHTVEFENFQLDIIFHFTRQIGIDQFDYWNGEFRPGFTERGRGNQPVTVLDRWQKPGDQSKIMPYSASTNSRSFPGSPILSTTDAWYSWDASYIRLENLSFSWKLPSLWLNKAGLQNGRIFSNAQNLLTLTKFSGLDPENQSAFLLPPLRTWTVGLQLGL